MFADVVATIWSNASGSPLRRSYVSWLTIAFAAAPPDLLGQRLADVDLPAMAERVGLAEARRPSRQTHTAPSRGDDKGVAAGFARLSATSSATGRSRSNGASGIRQRA